MRNTKLILTAVVTLTFLVACAKEETPATTATVTEPTAVQREPEVLPPPEPTEAVPAETTTADAPASTDTTSTAQPAPVPQSASTPAPMLPRRGEVASMTPQAPPAQANDPAASQRITIADAFEIVRAGNGVLVDVRTADAHKIQNIPGSIHIPYNEIATRARELPQDKWIITYCTCPAEESSGAAASTLKNMGFERVAALLGGMQGWRAQGLPIDYGQ